jgi:hypothetical protein
LTRLIDLVGKSGAHYRYQTLDEKRFLPPAGANYVIAEVKGGDARVVYAGETDNLAEQSWRQPLEQARANTPKAQVLTRLNVTRAVRKAEQADLIEQHLPPMNQ